MDSNNKEMKPPYLPPLPAPATPPGAAALLIHSPEGVGGRFLLEMSLDKNDLQSTKKTHSPVYSTGGSSARAGFASKRRLLTWSALPPP